MELHEAGDELLAHLQLSLGLSDARIGEVGVGLRHRIGVVDLPGQRCAQRGILSQQVVEDRGAGAGLADDDDGALDALTGHLGICLAPVGDLQPVAQRQDHIGGGHLHPDGGQIGLCDQIIDEPRQVLPPAIGVTEVIAAGQFAGLLD